MGKGIISLLHFGTLKHFWGIIIYLVFINSHRLICLKKMENKQTAVEWLSLQVKNSITLANLFNQIDGFEKEAKQMEKEQMESAWCNGYDNGWDKKDMDFQEYYEIIL